MRTPLYSGQFKQDVRTIEKRGKTMSKLRALMTLLIEGKPLAAIMRSRGNGAASGTRMSNRTGF